MAAPPLENQDSTCIDDMPIDDGNPDSSRAILFGNRRGGLRAYEKGMISIYDSIRKYDTRIKRLTTKVTSLENDKRALIGNLNLAKVELSNLKEDMEDLESDLALKEFEMTKLYTNISDLTKVKDAYDDMMGVLNGTNLDGANTSDLHEMSARLTKALGSIQSEIQKRFEAASRPKEVVFALPTCPCCLDNDRASDTTFACGHLVCRLCAGKLLECPICKQTAFGAKPLYGIERVE